jgi:hypothetical protein
VRQALDAVGELIAVRRHRDWYIWIARLMLLVAVVTIALWRFADLSLFWVEASVFLLFMLFWTVQTFELESRQVVILRPVTTVDGSQAGHRPQ